MPKTESQRISTELAQAQEKSALDVLRVFKAARTAYYQRFYRHAAGKPLVCMSELPQEVVASKQNLAQHSRVASDWFNKHVGQLLDVEGSYASITRFFLREDGVTRYDVPAQNLGEESLPLAPFKGRVSVVGAAEDSFGDGCDLVVELPQDPKEPSVIRRLTMPLAAMSVMQEVSVKLQD